MVSIVRYFKDYKDLWNRFVAIEGLPFLFFREYMEYHANRFEDSSLLFFDKKQLIAILPANRKGKILYSHEGLTFGSLFFKNDLGETIKEDVIYALEQFVIREEVENIICKPLPSFIRCESESKYLPSNKKIQEINLVIPPNQKVKIQQRRKRCYRKAIIAKLNFRKSTQWEAYWDILIKNLKSRHNRRPVHSLQEITLLKEQFPDNVQLFIASKEGDILAGTVVYFYPNCVAHCQYLATTLLGRKVGALDFVIFELQKYLQNQYSISLGVSTLRQANSINQGLYDWKAGFGAEQKIHNIVQMDMQELLHQAQTTETNDNNIHVNPITQVSISQ